MKYDPQARLRFASMGPISYRHCRYQALSTYDVLHRSSPPIPSCIPRKFCTVFMKAVVDQECRNTGTPFSKGARPRPVLVCEQTTPPPPPPTAEPSKLVFLNHRMEGDDLVISAAFDGPMKSLTYRLKPNEWLSLDYVYAMSGT